MKGNSILKIFDDTDLVKICAPMVRYSKLQFRTLVREYGCDICYTPMIMADSFCKSEKARCNEFTTNSVDTPLVVQFAANTVHDFVGATHMVLPYSDGVELNCGCPQKWAIADGYGCALLSKPELISDLIRQCRAFVPQTYTISAKIRILSDLRKTIELCQNLEKAGVSYITIHGRTPSQRNEPINTDLITNVKDVLQIPVVANGDVKSLQDARNIQEITKCDGVMVARGILTNPALFAGYERTPVECVERWINICYNTVVENCLDETHSFPERSSNLSYQTYHHHLVFMLEKVLTKQQRKIFNNLKTFREIQEFLSTNLQIVPDIYDIEQYQRQKIIDLDYTHKDQVYLKLLKESGIENVETNKEEFF